jgi:hypothetical protein
MIKGKKRKVVAVCTMRAYKGSRSIALVAVLAFWKRNERNLYLASCIHMCPGQRKLKVKKVKLYLNCVLQSEACEQYFRLTQL